MSYIDMSYIDTCYKNEYFQEHNSLSRESKWAWSGPNALSEEAVWWQSLACKGVCIIYSRVGLPNLVKMFYYPENCAELSFGVLHAISPCDRFGALDSMLFGLGQWFSHRAVKLQLQTSYSNPKVQPTCASGTFPTKLTIFYKYL